MQGDHTCVVCRSTPAGLAVWWTMEMPQSQVVAVSPRPICIAGGPSPQATAAQQVALQGVGITPCSPLLPATTLQWIQPFTATRAAL